MYKPENSACTMTFSSFTQKSQRNGIPMTALRLTFSKVQSRTFHKVKPLQCRSPFQLQPETEVYALCKLADSGENKQTNKTETNIKRRCQMAFCTKNICNALQNKGIIYCVYYPKTKQSDNGKRSKMAICDGNIW